MSCSKMSMLNKIDVNVVTNYEINSQNNNISLSRIVNKDIQSILLNNDTE